MSQGRFISFEGIEGVGKSTQIRVFSERLERHGIEVVITREPGGTSYAEDIRELLKSPREESMPPVAELLLMFAARAINVENTIRPALERGAWVIADRFTDSTRAYQGAGRGISLDEINSLAQLAHGQTHPQLTILLDAPVEVGLARAGKRGAADRFELEQRAFFERVREGYLQIAHQEPARIVIIDAAESMEKVSKSVEDVADAILKTTLD